MKILPVVGAQKGAQEFLDGIVSEGVVIDEQHPDYIVVLGGDGTFLGAERAYYKMGVPFVGVGFGRVNFLLNRSIASPQKFVEALQRDQWIKFPVHGIRAEIVTESGVHRAIAFNDVYLKSQDPTHVVRLSLTTNEYNKQEIAGDGVIIATPQGSTAYNRNAGGTILPLDSALWCLTGICTQHRVRVVLSHQKIVIDVHTNGVMAATDNDVYRDVKKVMLTPSAYSGIICFNPEENFEQRRYQS